MSNEFSLRVLAAQCLPRDKLGALGYKEVKLEKKIIIRMKLLSTKHFRTEVNNEQLLVGPSCLSSLYQRYRMV